MPDPLTVKIADYFRAMSHRRHFAISLAPDNSTEFELRFKGARILSAELADQGLRFKRPGHAETPHVLDVMQAADHIDAAMRDAERPKYKAYSEGEPEG
jgi:hypothetical protein